MERRVRRDFGTERKGEVEKLEVVARVKDDSFTCCFVEMKGERNKVSKSTNEER